MSFDKFDTVWMLEKMRKRRKIENFELQSLRYVVKEGGPNIVSNFEKKFKEIRQKERESLILPQCTQNNYQPLITQKLSTKKIEASYMGTESESRKRFQRNCSFSQQRGQS